MHTRSTAEFVEGARGPLMVVARRPVDARQCILLVPPFAEEMNKSRRMMTEASMGLAARGFATVLPDLYGTGDSAGEFAQADWAAWIEDIATAAAWSRKQGWELSGVLGVRLGCALAAQALGSKNIEVPRSVFWQPVSDGARFLTQFLRLRVAASMMSASAESVPQLRERLKAEGRLEVAGYEVSAQLCDEIEKVKLDSLLGPQLGELHWLEIVRDAEGELQGGSRATIERARQRGLHIHAQALIGEPFWSSTEIVLAPQLIERTLQALS